jgi:hypothetical protein
LAPQVWPAAQQMPLHGSPAQLYWHWLLEQPVGVPFVISPHGAQLGPQLSMLSTSQVPSAQRRVFALHWHVPPVQVSPASQGSLQPPQCASSFCVFTHWAPHIIMLAPLHSLRHMRFMQAVPVSQASPHSLQFMFVPIGVHALLGPPQRSLPSGQLQAPASHVVPVGHGIAQPPQFASSVCVFTHWLPHIIMLAPLHWLRHMLFMQIVPASHASSHALQLALVLSGVHWLPSPQGTLPAGHSHSPAWQVVPPVQAVLQPPQCALLVCVFTQASPHWTAGAVHIDMHMPPLPHISPGSQVLSQSPQLAGVLSGTHAEVGPPQRAWPAGHPQMPPVQVIPGSQSLSHPPQWASSV